MKGEFTAVCLKTIEEAAQETSPLFSFCVRFISRVGKEQGKRGRVRRKRGREQRGREGKEELLRVRLALAIHFGKGVCYFF